MQVVPHALSLVFGTYTNIHEIPDDGFPSHYFNFRQHRELYSKINVKEGLLTGMQKITHTLLLSLYHIKYVLLFTDYIGSVQYVSNIQRPVNPTQDSSVWLDIGIQNLE